jgi:methionyl-tRNA formyltransferase
MFSVLPELVELVDQMLQSRGDKLVGLVTAPGPSSRRTEEFREVMKFARPGLDVIVSNFPNRWADMIRPLRPDVLLCIGSNWKIPDDVLSVPTMGALNGHDGFLPKYRGRNATGWALRTGDPGYGASIHRITSEFDCGPVMAQHEIVIGDDEDGDDILPRLEEAGAEALTEAYSRLLEGFPGIPQDETEATWAGGEFEPEWREIDWNRPVRDVFFQIRSWSGFRGVPRGAYAEIDGQRVLITKAKPAQEGIDVNGARPGTIVSRGDADLLVQCADRPLRVTKWAPE